jgi:hypothetical protein
MCLDSAEVLTFSQPKPFKSRACNEGDLQMRGLQEIRRALMWTALAFLALALLMMVLATNPLPAWAGQVLCDVAFDGEREWDPATQSCSHMPLPPPPKPAPRLSPQR